MRTIVALAGALLLVPSAALADEPSPPAPKAPEVSVKASEPGPVTTAGAPVNLSSRGGLSRLAEGGSRARQAAGSARDVRVVGAESVTARPAATPRVLERMNVARALGALDGALQQCTNAGAPMPAVRLVASLSVTAAGTVESVTVSGGTLPNAVAACVTSVLTSRARFRTPGAAGAMVTVPLALAARTASAPTAAAPPPPAAAPAATALAAAQQQ